MKLPGVSWRTMTDYDVPAVSRIAAEVHPKFPESDAVLAERRALYHNGAYLLEVNEKPAGYVLSHPWRLDTLPELDRLLEALPTEPDTYYIHDLAILPLARRIGAGEFILEALTKHAGAQGFASMSLVAVNGSRSYWARHGFAVEAREDLRAKLATYEDEARLMVRHLGAAQ